MRDEKLYLLGYILESIRGNWGFGVEERLYRAIELANELGLDEVVSDINEFLEDEFQDGRYFRDCDCGYGYVYSLIDIKSLEDLTNEHIINECNNIEHYYL